MEEGENHIISIDSLSLFCKKKVRTRKANKNMISKSQAKNKREIKLRRLSRTLIKELEINFR